MYIKVHHLNVHLSFMILFVITSYSTSKTTSNGSPKQNPVLESAGRQISKSLNHSVNLCDDFYEFVCGNWASTQSIPIDAQNYDYFEVLKSTIANNVRSLLEQPTDNSIEAKFYRKCLDKDRINQLGHQPMAKLLHRLSGYHWPIVYPEQYAADSLPNWHHFLASLFPLNVNPLFSIEFYAHPNMNHRSTILLEPPKFDQHSLNPAEMYEIASLFASTQHGPQVISSIALRQRVMEVFSFELLVQSIRASPSQSESGQFGLNALEVQTNNLLCWTELLNGILRKSMQQFATSINSGHSNYGESMDDAQLIAHSMKVLKLAFQLAQNQNVLKHDANYAKLSRLIDHSHLALIKQWISGDNVISQLLYSFFNRPMYAHDDVVLVKDMEYFRKLAKLLTITPNYVIVNYMGWKVISHFRNYIGGKTWDVLHQNDETTEPLWKHCVQRVIKVYPWNISHRYVKRFVPRKVKSQANKLMQHSKYMFEQLIRHSGWMDSHTRQQAIEKLRSMKEFVAYPDWLLEDYQFGKFGNLAIYNDAHEEFFEMAIQKLSFHRIWQLLTLKLTSLNDFQGWIDAPIVVGAYHDPVTNSIAIPFSILQPPFFHSTYPFSLNYGGIVPIISHELIHGFDTNGRLYDQMGYVSDWWQPFTKQWFNSKAMCLVGQYEQIVEPMTGMQLNGYNTVGENIADNGAIRVAYYAFKSRWHNSPRVPHLELFSAEQTFFLQYAQTYCAYVSPRQMAAQILADPHSPEKYRVNVPLSNFEPFSRAFHCPATAPMNNAHKCTVW